MRTTHWSILITKWDDVCRKLSMLLLNYMCSRNGQFVSSLGISSEATCYILVIFGGHCLQQSLKESVLVPGTQQIFHTCVYIPSVISEWEKELHRKGLDRYNLRLWIQKTVPGRCDLNKFYAPREQWKTSFWRIQLDYASPEGDQRKAGSRGLSSPSFRRDEERVLWKDSCVRWRELWHLTTMFSEVGWNAGVGRILRRKCSSYLPPLLSVRSTGCPLCAGTS